MSKKLVDVAKLETYLIYSTTFQNLLVFVLFLRRLTTNLATFWRLETEVKACFHLTLLNGQPVLSRPLPYPTHSWTSPHSQRSLPAAAKADDYMKMSHAHVCLF